MSLVSFFSCSCLKPNETFQHSGVLLVSPFTDVSFLFLFLFLCCLNLFQILWFMRHSSCRGELLSQCDVGVNLAGGDDLHEFVIVHISGSLD